MMIVTGCVVMMFMTFMAVLMLRLVHFRGVDLQSKIGAGTAGLTG